MDCILKGANVYIGGKFVKTDITICDDTIKSLGVADADYPVIDCTGYHIFPGFTDVHVHLREPGFSYKETIRTGTMAASRGGYTAVCSMPNLNPVPDTAANLAVQREIIERDAVIGVYPYASITKGEDGGELSDMEQMAEAVVGFSDDGKGVQCEEMMASAMRKAKELDKIIAAHCEDNSLLNGGYIHDGEYAALHGHRGICSESEWGPIARDLELVKKIGCKYHICHISTKESVDLIRKAKAEGLSVTCETGPHYLVFNDCDIEEDGRFKMNPPIRSEEDRLALIHGIRDGTIDMIATDHAPHSFEEKSRGLEKSLMGIVGIETAFPILYTSLVKTGIISLEKLLQLIHDNPNERFQIGTDIKEGEKANITVFDLEEKYLINADEFLSKGKSTPFEGKEVFGKCILTMYKGDIAWKESMTEN
ncbi:MAG: dihydroorotase [Clostridia bacterium]|nr:dihydroorotase [Clostridia bacterium]